MESDTLVRLEHVEIAMDGEVILRDANFTLHAGEFVYLIGRVGSGKSSFLRALYAELPVETGEATIMGYDLRGITLRDTAALRRRLGIVFQDFQLLTDRTVRLNLEFILRATGWKNPDDIDRRIAETLTRTGIPDKAERMIHELSGGEQQRVAIARALLNTPAIILADEPTGNLDPETGRHIVSLLHDICRSGTAVVMTTHNYDLVRRFPARVVRCEGGRLSPLEQAAEGA
ncbi:phosphonate ABC transporter ATP-binding protein [Tannerella sp. oral taxon 808]|nr:phosphonate ABC transporter ATP-binding protein [Tannerella sp. oral taxon 808]